VERKLFPYDRHECGYTYVYVTHDELRASGNEIGHVTERPREPPS
jgi:hypothetical protein